MQKSAQTSGRRGHSMSWRKQGLGRGLQGVEHWLVLAREMLARDKPVLGSRRQTPCIAGTGLACDRSHLLVYAVIMCSFISFHGPAHSLQLPCLFVASPCC